MKKLEIKIAELSYKKNKFGIVAGSSILQRFSTLEKANEALNNNSKLYEYWADSVSVQISNSKKIIRYI